MGSKGLALGALALCSCAEPDFLVNTTTLGDQLRPEVIALEEGFLVAFGDLSGAAPDTSLAAIRGRRFSERGEPLDAADAVFNDSKIGAQNFPRGAQAGDGNLILVWEEAQGQSADVSGDTIRARAFGPDGAPRGADLLVPTTLEDDQRAPAVACGQNVCLVVWEDSSLAPPDDSGIGIRGRFLTSTGELIGSDFLLNQGVAGDQITPAVASLGEAGFVVAWGSAAGDGDGGAVLYRRVSLAGELLGDEEVAGDIAAGDQLRPSAAASEDFFVLAWEDSAADSDGGIRARLFDLSGAPRGGSFVVNGLRQGLQSFPAVAASRGGDILIAWRDDSRNAGQEIRARRFSRDGEPEGEDFGVNLITEGDQTTPRVAALRRGFVVVFEDSSGVDDRDPRAIRAALLR